MRYYIWLIIRCAWGKVKVLLFRGRESAKRGRIVIGQLDREVLVLLPTKSFGFFKLLIMTLFWWDQRLRLFYLSWYKEQIMENISSRVRDAEIIGEAFLPRWGQAELFFSFLWEAGTYACTCIANLVSFASKCARGSTRRFWGRQEIGCHHASTDSFMDAFMWRLSCCTYLNHQHTIGVSLITLFQNGLHRRMDGWWPM